MMENNQERTVSEAKGIQKNEDGVLVLCYGQEQF